MVPTGKTGNAAFEIYCRAPGTRIAKIMRLIDEGYDDKTIASMYNFGDKMPCSAQDIAVYLKAHDGKLTEPDGTPFHWNEHEKRDAAIMALRQLGYQVKELHSIFGLDNKTVYRILKGK